MAGPIEGYCWPISASCGEYIDFMISGEGSIIATFARQRSVASTIDPVFMSQLTFEANPQAVQAEPWRVGCGWAKTFRFRVPSMWPSGVYAATCRDVAGNECSIPFVVRAFRANPAPLGVLTNVNTWLAYNSWGGKGKYDSDGAAARVSFLRPNPNASPNGAPHLTRGELWTLGWLDREDLWYDVITDIDFHNDGAPSQWKALIVHTHPEYWTLRMYDNLLSYLNGGGSLVYLGGNGIFENAEYDENQTGMIFRAGIEQGPREAAMFRLLNPPRHERAVLGVATERSGAPGSAYIVEPGKAKHPLFDFTGLTEGGKFGDFGLNNSGLPSGYSNGKASGWEVDTADGPGAVGLPADSDLHPDEFPVPPSTLPGGLTVLARGEPDEGGRGADMVIYNHAAGGFVFSAGSITFGGSLVVDNAIRHIVLNVLGRAGIQSSSYWVGADFTGNRKDDILFYYPPDDKWWLGEITDNRLVWSLVGNTVGFGHNITDGRPFWGADFTGDGKSNILFYYPGDDNWWLGTITNRQLIWTLVATSHGMHGPLKTATRFWVADFTGDGGSDLLFYNGIDDNWRLGTITNGQLIWILLDTSQGPQKPLTASSRFWVADFIGDGRSDLLFYNGIDDNWRLSSLANGKLTWTIIDNTAAFGHNILDGRPFWVSDFTGDGKSDVLFYYPGDDNWWLGSVTNGRLTWTLVGNTLAFGHGINDGRPFWWGDFAGEGRNGILFHYLQDDNWWLGSIANGELLWTLVGNSA